MMDTIIALAANLLGMLSAGFWLASARAGSRKAARHIRVHDLRRPLTLPPRGQAKNFGQYAALLAGGMVLTQMLTLFV